MMLILGIDPGLSGAWAALDARGAVIALDDLPVVRDQKLAWIDGAQLCRDLRDMHMGRPVTAIVERISPQPKNGAKTMLSQGLTLGSILAALQVAGLRIEFVAPPVWKRALGLTFEKDVGQTQRKHASLDKARLLFPDAPLTLAKHNGRAEALLIAHWYHRTHRLGVAA